MIGPFALEIPVGHHSQFGIDGVQHVFTGRHVAIGPGRQTFRYLTPGADPGIERHIWPPFSRFTDPLIEISGKNGRSVSSGRK
jgi:hypothetical protein